MTALKKNRKYQSISQLLRLNIVSGKFSFRPTHMIMYTRQTVKYFLLWIMVPKVSKPSLLWLALLWTEMSLQLFPFLFGYISQPSEQLGMVIMTILASTMWCTSPSSLIHKNLLHTHTHTHTLLFLSLYVTECRGFWPIRQIESGTWIRNVHFEI